MAVRGNNACRRTVSRDRQTKVVNFGVPGGPLERKFTNLENDVQQGQISTRSDNLSTRYLFPNVVDFVESVTDKQTVNNTMRRQKNS